MIMQKFVLGYYAVLFTVFGMLMPSVVSNLIHYDISLPGATMEFMATYGGLFLGLGGFLFYCLKSNIQTGMFCVLLTMGAMFVSRIVGLGLYGGADYIQYIYLGGELFTVILTGLILIKPLDLVMPNLADN